MAAVFLVFVFLVSFGRLSQGSISLPSLMARQVPGALGMAEPSTFNLSEPSSCTHPCQNVSCSPGTTCRLVQQTGCLTSSCHPLPSCVGASPSLQSGDVSACGAGGAVLGEDGVELDCGPGTPCPPGTSCLPSPPGLPARCCLLLPPDCPPQPADPESRGRSRPPPTPRLCPRPALLPSCRADCLTSQHCRVDECCCPSSCGTRTCVKIFVIHSDRTGLTTSGIRHDPSNPSSRDHGQDGGPPARTAGMAELPRGSDVSRFPGPQRAGETRSAVQMALGRGIVPLTIDMKMPLAQSDLPKVTESNFPCPDPLHVRSCRNQCRTDADCGNTSRKCCRTRCNTGICAGSRASLSVWMGR